MSSRIKVIEHNRAVLVVRFEPFYVILGDNESDMIGLVMRNQIRVMPIRTVVRHGRNGTYLPSIYRSFLFPVRCNCRLTTYLAHGSLDSVNESQHSYRLLQDAGVAVRLNVTEGKSFYLTMKMMRTLSILSKIQTRCHVSVDSELSYSWLE